MFKVFKMLKSRTQPIDSMYQPQTWIANVRQHRVGMVTHCFEDRALVAINGASETWFLEDTNHFQDNTEWYVIIRRNGILSIGRVLDERVGLTGAFGKPASMEYYVSEHDPMLCRSVLRWIPDYLIVDAIAPVCDAVTVEVTPEVF